MNWMCRVVPTMVNKPTPLFSHLGNYIFISFHFGVRPFLGEIIGLPSPKFCGYEYTVSEFQNE